MELEDKVKKLKDEFQGLPKPLFRAILCNNKVNGDLTAAVRCLQQFEPKKNTRMRNLPATAADKELKKGLSCTPLDGLSQKENNWTGEGKRKRSKPQPSTLSERSMKTPPPSQSSKPAPPPKPQSARLHSQSSIPRPSVATKLRSTQSPPQTSKPPPPLVAPKPRSTQPPSQTRTGKPPPAVARKPRSTQSPSHTRTSEPPPPPVALKPRSTQPPSQTRTGKPPPPPVAPKPRSTQPPSQTRTGTPQPPAVARKPRSTQSPSQTRTGKPPPPPVAPKPRSTQPPSQTRTGTPQPPAVALKLRPTPSFSKSSKPALPQKTESTQTASQSSKLIPPPVALKPQSIRSLSQSSRKASPPKLQSAPPPSQSSKQEHPLESTHLLSPSSRQASPPNPKSSGFAKQGIDFKPEAGDALSSGYTPRDGLNQCVEQGESAGFVVGDTVVSDRTTPCQLSNALSPQGRPTELVNELKNIFSSGSKFAGKPKYLVPDNSDMPEKRPMTNLTTIIEETETEETVRITDPPGKKPKLNWRRQRENDEDCIKSAGPPLSISEMNPRSLQERLLSHLSHEEDFPPSTTQHKQCNEPLPRAPRSSPLSLTSRPPAMLKVQPNLQLQVFSSKSSLDINDTVTDKIRKSDDAALEKCNLSLQAFIKNNNNIHDYDVAGDLTKGRKQPQDPNNCCGNFTEAQFVERKLYRDIRNSPSCRPEERGTKMGRGGGNILPENWTPMSHDNEGNGISVDLVKLDSSSPEYQKVMDRILETLHSVDIVSIERVQNYYLYQAYQLLKQKMESDRGESNERQLFHGTIPDNTKKINYSGFDWRFSGSAHGAMYGAGVNFARDASYSIHYATRPSAGPHCVMYLARVLVGRYCLGKKGMMKPPPVNPEFPEILFDSTVDNLANPSITVVYQDSQCYPEYLITFRKTG